MSGPKAEASRYAGLAPLTVTDVTCLERCGFPPRAWRNALDELGVPKARIGRRTVVRLDDWLAAIDRLSGRAPANGPSPASDWDEDAVVAAAVRGRR